MATTSVDKLAIEEDWQQVDDAGSVHSLPLTDDPTSDADLVDLGEQSASIETWKKKALELRSEHSHDRSSKAVDQLSPTPVIEQPRNESASVPTDAARQSGTHLEAPKSMEQKCDPEAGGQTDEDDEDEDVDPDHILNFAPKLANLRCRLNDVMRDTERYMEDQIAFQTPLIRSTHTTLRGIQEQMKVIGPLVQECADIYRTYNGDMDSEDLPVHGDLPAWTRQLHDVLLTYQSHFDAVASGRTQIVEAMMSLQQPNESLTTLRQTMDDFLPLILADFDSFKTKHMGFNEPEPGPKISRTASRDDNQTVAALRTAFYRLHDEVRQTLELIMEIKSSKPDPSIANSAPPVISSLSIVRDAIMNIITNNPSEWMESDLNSARKILSYPAFIALSPDMLSDVTDQLNQVRQQLDVTNDPDMGQSFSREVIHAHQVMLLAEGGQMQELQSTANFLESLLVPGGASS